MGEVAAAVDPVDSSVVAHMAGSLGLDGGIAVTASHNPKEYTGMKLVRRGALPVGGESGLLDVRDRAIASNGLSEAKASGSFLKSS